MTLYALSSSNSPDIHRYIGMTAKRPQTRLNEHLSESRYLRTHKDKWIQKELKTGNKIVLSEIDSAQSVVELKEKEIGYIKLMKSVGAKLVNGTHGGDGSYGHKASEAAKLKNSINKSKKVFMFSSKTKELISEYPSITKMINENGFSSSQVSKVLAVKSSNHKGFVFSYTNIFPKVFQKQKFKVWNAGISTKGKQRFKTSSVRIRGNGIDITFKTVAELASYLDVHHSQICNSIKNRNGKYKKYFIEYIIN